MLINFLNSQQMTFRSQEAPEEITNYVVINTKLGIPHNNLLEFKIGSRFAKSLQEWAETDEDDEEAN